MVLKNTQEVHLMRVVKGKAGQMRRNKIREGKGN